METKDQQNITKRQTNYVSRNIKARSFNHCYGGNAIIITCSECVFVDLGIQHAMRVRHIIMRGLSGFTEDRHVPSYRHVHSTLTSVGETK